MPRAASIKLRPIDKPSRPNLKFILRIPRHLRPLADGAASRFFPTKREGEAFATWLVAQQKKFGESALNLPNADQVDALQALVLLRPLGCSLLDAARIAAEKIAADQRTCTVAELEPRYLAALRSDGADPEHLRTAKAKIRRFVDNHPDVLLTAVTTPDLDAWLRAQSDAATAVEGKPWGPVTRNGVRAYLRAAFEFARKAGLVRVNPVGDTSTVSVGGKPVSILTPDQIRTLLGVDDPVMRLYFAVGAFAGLRPVEIAKLRWEHFKLAKGVLGVDTDDPRSYANRWVTLNPTLLSWLAPRLQREGPVVPLTAQLINQRRRAAAEAAGLMPWPVDVLRHSFASYHLAAHNDLAATMREMGHSSAKMIAAHYRERVEPGEAARWWAVKCLA